MKKKPGKKKKGTVHREIARAAGSKRSGLTGSPREGFRRPSEGKKIGTRHGYMWGS